MKKPIPRERFRFRSIVLHADVFACWDQLTKADLYLLAIIHLSSSRDKGCSTSNNILAELVGISPNKISFAIRRMKALGLIHTEKQDGQRKIWVAWNKTQNKRDLD